jgi:hypothetical protein
MFNKGGHLSKQDLLLFATGELSTVKADRVRKHLTNCVACRSRKLHLEHTMREWVCLYKTALNGQVLNGNAMRTRFKARLDEAARSTAKPWLRQFAITSTPQSKIYACCLLLVVTLGIFALYRQTRIANFESETVYVEAGPLPNRRFTPGAVRPVKLSEICPAQDDDLDPEVSRSVQEVVFREYGMAETRIDDYQVDYLINPQLGGASDIHNLWPQPYGSTVWNAHVKDALEDRLHEMVCNGQIDLPSAQKAIATDWDLSLQSNLQHVEANRRYSYCFCRRSRKLRRGGRAYDQCTAIPSRFHVSHPSAPEPQVPRVLYRL